MTRQQWRGRRPTRLAALAIMAAVTIFVATLTPSRSAPPGGSRTVAEPSGAQQEPQPVQPAGPPGRVAPPPEPTAPSAPGPAGPPSAAGPKSPGTLGSDPETVIVRFQAGVSDREAADFLAGEGLAALRPVGATGHLLVDTRGTPPADVVRRLGADRRVAVAEPNYLRKAVAEPNDPRFSTEQGYLAKLGMPAAWDRSTGSESVLIGVIDTGVDFAHPELAGRISPAGWDFVNNDGTANDDNGHGTRVAGIAAARTNNGQGVAGAAWNASVLPVKVLDNKGGGTDADVASGITWAVDHGARIVNLSLGGPDQSQALRSALEYAQSRNVVVVAAAGNDGSPGPFYPAASPGVLAVTATDQGGDFASFSNFGPWVSLAAPGIAITGPSPGGQYATGNGTSFASPIVAGIAALVRAANPSLSQQDVVAKLRDTARDAGPPGLDDEYGYGWVDPVAALGGTPQPRLPSPAPDAYEPNGTPARAAAVPAGASATISPEGDVDWFFTDLSAASTLDVTVQPPGGSASSTARTMDPVVDVYDPLLRRLGSADANDAGVAEQLSVRAPAPGRYYVRVGNFSGSRSPGAYSVSTTTRPLGPGAGPAEKPWVRDTSPADFSLDVAPDSPITVGFARDMEPSSFTADTVKVRHGVTGELVPVSPVYDGASATLAMAPSCRLTGSTPYGVELSGVRDLAGQLMPRMVFRFRTGGGPGQSCISISDARVDEGDAGTTTATFTMSLTAPASAPASVRFDTAQGTALTPGDYRSAGGVVTFDPGQARKTVSVPVVGDQLDEADETFAVRLSDAVNLTLLDREGTGTIVDDDPKPPAAFTSACQQARPPSPSSYRPTNRGEWYLRNTNLTGVGEIALRYGDSGDIPIVGDWNGDGIDTPGIFRGGWWFLRNSNSSGVGEIAIRYGDPGDIPIVGDWDGDGIDTPGIVRGNWWFLRNSNTTGVGQIFVQYGDASDVAIVGDWDGDGVDTPGIVRCSIRYLRNSNTSGPGEIGLQYGDAGDVPIVGDWNGDGIDTPGAVRGNSWFLRNSNTSGSGDIGLQYADFNDIRLVGDWNGDGVDTPGVAR